MATPTPILSVRDLTRTFGATTAVDGLSFDVGPGEMVGLLGPNGAGKSTTIDMILGVLAPTAGTVEIEGLDVGRRRVEALSRTNFAAVSSPLPGNLTVAENLRVFGMIYGVPRPRRAHRGAARRPSTWGASATPAAASSPPASRPGSAWPRPS